MTVHSSKIAVKHAIMPTQRVDIAKLALNLDGCRFGSPPMNNHSKQQRLNKDVDQRHQSVDTNDGQQHVLSPLSTHHKNHRAQYNNYSSQYDNGNELTSPLGTTYRREGLSIGRNFLRFQGSTLSDKFNLNQLDVLECIGRGVCSSVWKARRKREGVDDVRGDDKKIHQHLESKKQRHEEYYALKIFSMRDPQKRTMLIRELKLLCSTADNPEDNNSDKNNHNDSSQQGQGCECLVELEGAFLDETDGTVTLVLEYMNFGSLADLLSRQSSTTTSSSVLDEDGTANDNNPMPEYAIASIAYQMIWGLGYLHHEGVQHRDIKPANVLLSSEGKVKLADFGIVSNNDSVMNVTMIGTTRYMSLERLRGKLYNKQADIWSLGLILLELTRGGGNSPFEDVSSVVELVQTLDDCISMGQYIPEGTSEGLSEILMGCLNHCPEKRMPADVLIGSPWFELNGIECVDDAVVNMKRYLKTLNRHST